MTTSAVKTPVTDYDPLDMNNYSLNKLPKRPLTKVGKFLSDMGVADCGGDVRTVFVRHPISDSGRQAANHVRSVCHGPLFVDQ